MRRRRSPAIIGVVLALVVALAGCGDDTPARTQAEQEAIATTEALLISEGFGCRLLGPAPPAVGVARANCAWVADTAAERERGLKGVTDPSLGGHEVMAFVFDAPTTASFWMKDTLIPLTVVWVGADGRILGSTDMEPCDPSGSRCPNYAPPGPYTMAIEVARGRAPDLGLVTGASVILGDPCGP